MTATLRPLETLQDAERVLALSHQDTVLVYKHSPVCSISETAIEEILTFAGQAPDTLNIFMVDVLAARPASLKIEELTGVRHESPQVLLLVDGAPVWHASHGRVRSEDLLEQVRSLD
jgi:bacillithiol system protein YtxJ